MESEKELQERLMLYQVTSNELSSLKPRQWSLTSNTFFLFVAITAIANLIGDNIKIIDKLLLSFLTILVLIMSSLVLYKLRVATNNREKIYKEIADYFHSSNKNIIDKYTEKKGPPSYKLLRIAIFIGAIISIWVIFRQPTF